MTVPAYAATITYDATDHAIHLNGMILEGDYANFKTLREKNNSDIVIMTSPGGLYSEAEQIGIYIYKNKMATVTSRGCYSACAYIWLAGSPRLYDDTHEALAPQIHNPYTIQDDNVPIDISGEGWYFGQINVPQSVAWSVSLHSHEDLLPLTIQVMGLMGLDTYPYSQFLAGSPLVPNHEIDRSSITDMVLK